MSEGELRAIIKESVNRVLREEAMTGQANTAHSKNYRTVCEKIKFYITNGSSEQATKMLQNIKSYGLTDSEINEVTNLYNQMIQQPAMSFDDRFNQMQNNYNNFKGQAQQQVNANQQAVQQNQQQQGAVNTTNQLQKQLSDALSNGL